MCKMKCDLATTTLLVLVISAEWQSVRSWRMDWTSYYETNNLLTVLTESCWFKIWKWNWSVTLQSNNVHCKEIVKILTCFRCALFWKVINLGLSKYGSWIRIINSELYKKVGLQIVILRGKELLPNLEPWKWRTYAPLKSLYPPRTLRNVTVQWATIWIVTY